MVVDLFLKFRLLIKPPTEKTLQKSWNGLVSNFHRLTPNDKLCFCIIISTVQLFLQLFYFTNETEI